MKNLLPYRSPNSHKGTFKTVLNISGSKSYIGAGILSSLAVLKVGAGKVILASEGAVLTACAAQAPEIILKERKSINKKNIEDYDVYIIGCGFSQTWRAEKDLKKILKFLENTEKPVLIDADGLNILSRNKIELAKNTILTPHPKEISRLLGVEVEEVIQNPEASAKQCSRKYNCVTVLKLHETIICSKDLEIHKNTTGNSALAKGGSGDILSGMIGGFLAQGLTSFDSCKLGVYLLGIAGELASKDLTEYGVLASDLIKYIPNAIKEIL